MCGIKMYIHEIVLRIYQQDFVKIINYCYIILFKTYTH